MLSHQLLMWSKPLLKLLSFVYAQKKNRATRALDLQVKIEMNLAHFEYRDQAFEALDMQLPLPCSLPGAALHIHSHKPKAWTMAD